MKSLVTITTTGDQPHSTWTFGLSTLFKAALVAGCFLGWCGGAQAQSDNFNDGNDNGWTHLDLNTGTGGQLPGATYAFPNDGVGGKAYQIKAGAPPVPDAGPARAFSYPAPSYTRFSVGADMINWDTTVDQAFGLLVRATTIALGQTAGYVMNYNVADGNLQINSALDESPTTIAEIALPMTPAGGPYRWVFTGYGDNLLGQVFVLPDLVNPIGSVVASDSQSSGGQAGLFVFNRADPVDYTNPNSFADATFDNYDATVPVAGSLRATVVQLAPYPREQARPAYPLVQAAILDRETSVLTNTIQLWVDGVQISAGALTLTSEVIVPNNPTPFPGATVSYPITTLYPVGTVHNNRLVYGDSVVLRTNDWTFTTSYPLLRATNSTPPGSGRNPGFALRLVQAAPDAGLANNIAVAQVQLAVPSTIPSIFSTNTTAMELNFTDNPLPSDSPYFPYADNFPGVPPDPPDQPYLAMRALAYLDLPQGLHRFGMYSDDGFQLTSGSSLTDLNGVLLGLQSSGTFDGTFEFVAEAAGVYPFRLTWYETTGDAHLQLYSVNLTTGALTLINDPNDPASIKAFLTLANAAVVLQSTATLTPPDFQTESGAIVDINARTITVARSGGQRFYRLSAATALTITSTSISGNNVVLRYQ